MIQINTYSAQNKAPENTKKEIIDFLFESLDQYGDPKEDIEKAMELLKPVQVKSPVHIGDVVVSNVCGTGVDWIATKNV